MITKSTAVNRSSNSTIIMMGLLIIIMTTTTTTQRGAGAGYVVDAASGSDGSSITGGKTARMGVIPPPPPLPLPLCPLAPAVLPRFRPAGITCPITRSNALYRQLPVQWPKHQPGTQRYITNSGRAPGWSRSGITAVTLIDTWPNFSRGGTTRMFGG